MVPLEEYGALKALEQREAELYWAVHEACHPSQSGDAVLEGKVYDSMTRYWPTSISPSEVRPHRRLAHRPAAASVVKGETVVVWLRVGNHSIYDS